MKKTKLFIALSSFALAAAGAFALGNSLSQREAQKVSADGEKVRVTIYINDPDNNFWCEANAITAIGCSNNVSDLYFFENRDTDFPTATIKGNTTLWSELSAVDPGNDFAGVIKGTTALIDKSVFGTTWESIRFARINPNDKTSSWTDKYGGSRAALVGSNAGTFMLYGDYVDTDYTYHKVTIHDGNNNATTRFFMVAQTGAYYPVATEKPGYTFDSWYTDPELTNEWESENWVVGDLNLYASYRPSITSNFYAYGDFDGESTNWDIGSAKMLSPFEEENYDYSTEATVSLKRGDKFKVAYYNDTNGDFDYSQNFGAAAVQSDSAAKYCFDLSDSGDVIECVAGGSYILRLHNFPGEGKTLYIGFAQDSGAGSRNAEQLAAYLMSFGANPESGHCEEASRFPYSKTMFLTQLSSSEQSKFQDYADSDVDQFKNAYLRYVAWAAASHEKPWEAGKTSGAPYVLSSTQESNNLIVIVSIVSLISASTLIGLIVIKRRRLNK